MSRWLIRVEFYSKSTTKVNAVTSGTTTLSDIVLGAGSQITLPAGFYDKDTVVKNGVPSGGTGDTGTITFTGDYWPDQTVTINVGYRPSIAFYCFHQGNGVQMAYYDSSVSTTEYYAIGGVGGGYAPAVLGYPYTLNPNGYMYITDTGFQAKMSALSGHYQGSSYKAHWVTLK